MDNRGKIWSIDDDQKLMEQPSKTNSFFATTMGRTENAIKCRRSHLAAKMHQNDPSVALEEYVTLMQGDFAHASTLLTEWNEKRASLRNFIDSNRKRKLLGSSFLAPVVASDAVSVTDNERITLICKRICDEGGNLTSMWNIPEFLPCLVQHHSGFEAYARVVRVLAAS
jgi:hypothetical protein